MAGLGESWAGESTTSPADKRIPENPHNKTLSSTQVMGTTSLYENGRIQLIPVSHRHTFYPYVRDPPSESHNIRC